MPNGNGNGNGNGNDNDCIPWPPDVSHLLHWSYVCTADAAHALGLDWYPGGGCSGEEDT